MDETKIVGVEYMKDRLMRTLLNTLILFILIVFVSFVNKTWLTMPLIRLGQVTKIWVTAADILGIYIAILYVEAFVDVARFGLIHMVKNWSIAGKERRRLEALEAEKET